MAEFGVRIANIFFAELVGDVFLHIDSEAGYSVELSFRVVVQYSLPQKNSKKKEVDTREASVLRLSAHGRKVLLGVCEIVSFNSLCQGLFLKEMELIFNNDTSNILCLL